MNQATKEVARFILSRQIKVMKFDLKYGDYSSEIKIVIEEKITETEQRYKNL